MLVLWSYRSIKYSSGSFVVIPFVCPDSAPQQLCVYDTHLHVFFLVWYGTDAAAVPIKVQTIAECSCRFIVHAEIQTALRVTWVERTLLTESTFVGPGFVGDFLFM